ncbi:hypothetical protein ACNIUX_27040, partial [Escherichia coli]
TFTIIFYISLYSIVALARLTMHLSAAKDAENNNACSLYTTKVNMSLFPVIVVIGMSFPPIFF